MSGLMSPELIPCSICHRGTPGIAAATAEMSCALAMPSLPVPADDVSARVREQIATRLIRQVVIATVRKVPVHVNHPFVDPSD